MKQFKLAFSSFIIFFLAGCSSAQVTLNPTGTTDTVGELQVRTLVENFGRRLQTVSLMAPDAAQEIQTQYSEFVSPSLLAEWTGDPSQAPGRVTSSPWPDHIEITRLSGDDASGFVITGFIIEVTSVEAVNGGAAARIPVRLVVQRIQARWLIAEFSQEK